MNCRTCNYALWSLRERRCPECGTQFRPSDFRFNPGTIRFCCPHCDQAYYGTGPGGHLQPAEFACVTCARHVSMDEMVLRPAEGVADERTTVEVMPWLETGRGMFSRFFATIARTLGMPVRLIRATPLHSPVGAAFLFAVLTALLYHMASLLPLFLFMFLGMAAGGGRGPGMGFMVLTLAFPLLAWIGGAIVALVVWMLLSHALLRLGGRTAGGLRRTAQCFFYASGANVLQAIPCIGLYLSVVSWVWPAVAAILMIRESQRVSGARAAFAVLVPPLAGVAIMVVLLAIAINGATFAPPVGRPTLATTAAIAESHTTDVLHALLARSPSFPPHAARLVLDGDVAPTQFILGGGPGPESIVIGRMALSELASGGAFATRELARAEIAQPPDIVAHRIGDFVLTYHGLEPHTAEPGLWLLIAEKRPISATGPGAANPDVWIVGLMDGSTNTFNTIDTALADQNTLRRGLGLPPIPHPGLVTQGRPAAASDPDPGP